MSFTIADRYRRWFKYEKETHARILDSLDTVPADQQSAAAFQKAVDLLAHIVAARWLWCFRMGETTKVKNVFPKGVALEELRAQIAEMHEVWSKFLAGLDDAGLERKFEYQSFEGEWFRDTVENICFHLMGHSAHHRGQVAALVRSLGAEPAQTDFVYWTREPVTRAKGA